MPPTPRAYLELARASNAPTVVTNVLMGCAIGAGFGPFPWAAAAAISLAAVLLYISGMALNDVVDTDVDRAERPARPIPSGRISRRAAFAFAGVCMAAGLAISAAFGLPAAAFALALAASIVAYNLLHQRSAATVVLMGLCRALVPLLAAAAVAWPIDLPLALGLAGVLGVYTILLSIVARVEVGDRLGPRRIAAAFMGLLPLLALVVVQRPVGSLWVAGALMLLAIWLAKAALHLRRSPPQIVPAVLTWLSGICLLDAYFLTLLDQRAIAPIALVAFAVTVALHRRIQGT